MVVGRGGKDVDLNKAKFKSFGVACPTTNVNQRTRNKINTALVSLYSL